MEGFQIFLLKRWIASRWIKLCYSTLQGSGKSPYELKATGKGETFYLSCSCPAGRKAGLQCKHARAILLGDVTALQEGSADVVELSKLAEGSAALAKALNRPLERMKNRPPAGVTCIRTLNEVGCPKIYASGLAVQYSEEGADWPSCRVSLHDHFKNGKVKVGPSLELAWTKLAGDEIMQADGSFTLENVRPRARPYTIRGKGITTITRKGFADAYDALIEAVERIG